MIVATEHLGEPLECDPPATQHPDLVAGAVDDRALDPDRARATVEDRVDVVAEIGAHVCRRRGADPAEPVGRRSRDPTGELAEQLEGERLVGDAQPDRVAATRDRVGDHAAGRGAPRS